MQQPSPEVKADLIRMLADLAGVKIPDDLFRSPTPDEVDRRFNIVCSHAYSTLQGEYQRDDEIVPNVSSIMKVTLKGYNEDNPAIAAVARILAESIRLYLRRRQKEDVEAFHAELIDCLDEAVADARSMLDERTNKPGTNGGAKQSTT